MAIDISVSIKYYSSSSVEDSDPVLFYILGPDPEYKNICFLLLTPPPFFLLTMQDPRSEIWDEKIFRSEVGMKHPGSATLQVTNCCDCILHLSVADPDQGSSAFYHRYSGSKIWIKDEFFS
jgi:hypothetical protein